MYLKLQIFLSILFYFNFVNSFTDSELVNKNYFDTLVIISETNLEGRIYSGHEDLVNMPNIKYATVCKKVLNDLRNNEAYVDMHVDVSAISMYNGKRCSIIWVWVPQLQAPVKQYACLCFMRPTINALDKPSEYLHYHDRYIMIYSKSIREVMIFKYVTNPDSYIVLDIFEKRWSEYHSLKIKEVRTVLPQSYGEISNLQAILKPIFCDFEFSSFQRSNVIYKLEKNISLVCKMMYRRARYIQEVYFPLQEEIPIITEQLTTVLITENNKLEAVILFAYTCRGYIPGTWTTISKYKIAAGHNNTSVILLRETVCPNMVLSLRRGKSFYFPTDPTKCYEISELIEHLTHQFVFNFYKDIDLFTID